MAGFDLTAPGISFSGGFTITNAPAPAPATNTAAWFGGGYSRSTVQRITYATDTATASVRGPLSAARYYLAAAGNATNGWFGGGMNPPVSTVNRITYATDTATASVRGPLSLGRRQPGAAANTTDGWFGGGYINAGGPTVSRVDRITFATDTATASVRGPLSLARWRLAAAGNTDYGWFGGGYSSSDRSTVDRIT